MARTVSSGCDFRMGNHAGRPAAFAVLRPRCFRVAQEYSTQC